MRALLMGGPAEYDGSVFDEPGPPDGPRADQQRIEGGEPAVFHHWRIIPHTRLPAEFPKDEWALYVYAGTLDQPLPALDD